MTANLKSPLNKVTKFDWNIWQSNKWNAVNEEHLEKLESAIFTIEKERKRFKNQKIDNTIYGVKKYSSSQVFAAAVDTKFVNEYMMHLTSQIVKRKR